jgi:hypothetical protein
MRSPGPGYVADLSEGKAPEKSSPPAKPYPSLAPPVEEWTQEDEILADLILAALQGIRWGRVPGGLHPGKLPGL